VAIAIAVRIRPLLQRVRLFAFASRLYDVNSVNTLLLETLGL
jgi:hypothetical protein